MKQNLQTGSVAIIAIAALGMSSCSPRIAGTWNVKRYETSQPGGQTISLSNIGTMTFDKNGSGTKNLRYNVLGINRDDQVPFTWRWEKNSYVAINSDSSELAKTWIIIDNKKKFQRWKSTTGATVQLLELSK